MANQRNNAGALAPVLVSAIDKSADQFDQSLLKFDKEKVFAVQQLMGNSFTQQIAAQNPTSLQLAMYQCAKVGLTLNPTLKLANLIPRKIGGVQKIILDIQYQGLIQLAAQAGAISSCVPTLVYENEAANFVWNGEYTAPTHPRNVFASSAERGAVIGGYCTSKLPVGSFQYYPVGLEYIHKCRDSSEMVKKNGVSGPWRDWEEEMIAKTIVKKAAKWWPKTSSAFGEAMRIINEDNAEGLAIEDRSAVIEGEVFVPEAQELPEKVVNFIAKIIDRSIEVGTFEAAEEVIETRFGKHPPELAFARSEIEKAKAGLNQDSNAA